MSGRLRFATYLSAVALAVLTPGMAHAQPDAKAGGLALSPPTGTLGTPMYVSSDAPCGGGEFFHIFVTGPGLDPKDNNITGATELAGLPRTADRSIYAPLSSTLSDFFADHHVNAPIGRYRVVLRCRAGLDLTSLGDFAGELDIDKAGRYAAVGAAARPVTKPNGGGLLGGNDPAAAAPSPAVEEAPVVAPAPSTVNVALIGGVLAFAVFIGALALAVTRRRPRPDTRPHASNEQRKVHS